MTETEMTEKVNACAKESPLTMKDLCSLIHEEMGDQGLETADVPKVQALLETYLSNSNDWKSYAMFENGRYTRNLVDDGNGKFNLMILCWAPGAQSAIHDHSNSHCLLKVLDGDVEESLYDWPEQDAPAVSNPEARQGRRDSIMDSKPGIQMIKQSVFEKDQVTYMHDKLGLHRIRNPSSSKGAVSLHLYSPPYQTCKTFCESTGASRSSGKIVFFSENGVKNNYIEEIYSKINGLSPVHSAATTGSSSSPICKRKGL